MPGSNRTWNWDTGRTQQLPPNWKQIRQAVAERAGWRCQAIDDSGQRCTNRGTDCDHIEPGNNHNLNNLQWLCHWHHARKTHDASTSSQTSLRQRNQPPERKHPGLL